MNDSQASGGDPRGTAGAVTREVDRPAPIVGRRGVLLAGLGAGALLSAPAASLASGRAGDPQVETVFGRVRGYRNGPVDIFKGVPFGAPTGGPNRWMPPRKPAPWTGVLDARAYGPRSPQVDSPLLPEEMVALGAEALGEDCLRLNVWTPRLTGRRPVMVWFHGGAYMRGSGAGVRYDGTRLASRQDVVVVTANHRLNLFGFLHLPRLHEDGFSPGNAGMLDCVAALEWVRDNIAGFGGDPNNVTIFGESGGGGKVSTLMAMPAARGLFHRAIAQSGVALRQTSMAAATRGTRALLGQLDVPPDRLEALQAIPFERLLGAMDAIRPGLRFAPVVDDRALLAHPFDPVAPAVSANVPFMMGSNETESTWFFDTPLDPIDAAALKRHVVRYTRIDDPDAEQLIATYRAEHPGRSNTYLYQLISSDWWLTSDTAIQAERKAAQGSAPAYVYQFRKPTPVRNGKLNVPHTLEIPYAFDNLHLAEEIAGPKPAGQALADRMSSAWAAFARTGDPNTAGLPHWPAYEPTERAVMQFDDACRVVNDPHRAARLIVRDLKAKQAATAIAPPVAGPHPGKTGP